VRVIHPYVVARAEGSWYTVGYCCKRKSVRVFRIDRVIEADATDDRFELQYESDAEIVEPEELREMMRARMGVLAG